MKCKAKEQTETIKRKLRRDWRMPTEVYQRMCKKLNRLSPKVAIFDATIITK